VKSTLKAVAKYEEDTKAGLKVFHLQQLSETSADDSMLCNDERYRKLKSDVFSQEVMKELSVAQVVAAFVAMGRLRGADKKEWSLLTNALKGFCETEKSHISPTQVCASLYWISNSGTALCMRDRAIVSTFKRLLRESNEWTPIDIGWLLFFMRNKHAVDHPVWERTLQQVAYRFNERLGKMSAKNISCILHEFSQLQLLPGRAIYRAMRRLESKLDQLDPKTNSILFLSLAKLKVYHTEFLHSLAKSALERDLVQKSDVRQLAVSMYALAKLDTFIRPFFAASLDRFSTEPQEKVTDADLAMVAYSLGRLGIISHKEVWDRILNLSKARLPTLSPLNISVLAWSMAKVGLVDHKFLRSISDRVLRDNRSFTPRQMTNIIYSFALSGRPLRGMGEFQVNVSKVRNNEEADREFPVMGQIAETFIHRYLTDFLTINGFSDVVVCPQVGAVWVDAIFSDEGGRRTAVLLLGDSDMCKLSKKEVLGSVRWKLKYLEKMGLRVIYFHRRDARSLTRLWSVPEVSHLVKSPAPTVRVRPIAPVEVDAETGKISFR
jgi:hypothetical protein